ncbi:hypothetical protein [Empedobacter falsenii]|uniref:Uncharacterized protein n=2 Tax=Empedobacter TaxID=59734 RepID=A0A427BPF4_9FLAO|nr:hypothetical protein [Empedobacter falsenii]RRT91821.1 hypothetical protein EGI89_07400 [Empedobacter falsenii]RRT92061.1 hypothetical protein EGI88_06940 [Empedobacter falsenii]
MKVYDKNKVLEVSRALFYEKYPDADCFVLTGSQLEEEFVSIVSDIDILIIDSNLSGVSSEGMFYKGYGGFKLLMQRLSKNSKKNDYLIC